MSVIDNARTALCEAQDWMKDHPQFNSAREKDVKALSAALRDLVAEHERLTADLDARFEHSDHTAAKYYQRMRAAEREMHARELHHFEEEQRSAGLAAVVEKVRGVIGAEVGWESPAILIDRIQWALSTAPADALAEHDARLIERLADDLVVAVEDDLPDDFLRGVDWGADRAMGWLRERAARAKGEA